MIRIPLRFELARAGILLSVSSVVILRGVPSVSSGASDSPSTVPEQILKGARREAAMKTPYIEDYVVLKYPGGDVLEGTGVCTDLVIRSFRFAGIDLQKLVHEDRVEHPEAYPTQIWDHKKADRNIDHRRCQNLAVWFKRHAERLKIDTGPESLKDWLPGDVVFYVRPGQDHPWHVAVVSDKRDSTGVPLIIDSYPPHTSESHRLTEWAPIHSHFRMPENRTTDKHR